MDIWIKVAGRKFPASSPLSAASHAMRTGETRLIVGRGDKEVYKEIPEGASIQEIRFLAHSGIRALGGKVFS